MADFDRDEFPMLSDTHPTLVDESLDSQSQASMSQIRSMSISIPMSSMDADMNRKIKVDKIWKKFFAICCLVALFLDPLFLLLLSVEKKNMCIAIDGRMVGAVVFFRSFCDLVYLLDIFKTPSQHVNRLNYLVDLFVVIPFPQVMVLWILPKYLGSSEPGANLLKNIIIAAVLIQYIPRLFRFLPLLFGLIFETWANFFTNLCAFVLSGYIIGSWWYLFGLQRVRGCLRAACATTNFGNQCLGFIDCKNGNYSNGLATNSNLTSWTNNRNAIACFSGDSFEYGIFKPAVNLTSEDITTRYVSSIFWGFQQISTLAGNQEPSYAATEVLFTMIIIGLGLLLVAFLIGNVQKFLQIFSERKLEFSKRQHDLKKWMNHRGLPEELKNKVRAAEEYNWKTTRGINEEMLIENLPENIQKDIRRHMFEGDIRRHIFGFLKTVEIFTSMDQHIMDAIYERVKRTIYVKGSKILYRGGMVDKMIFIVDGKLESIGDDRTVTLREGSVCGEELLTWFLEYASVSKDGKKMKVTGQQLHSNKTVRCLTDVEAFLLRAADLKEVIDHFLTVAGARSGNERG